MIFNFEERPSDSAFVERIWRTQSERVGAFTSLAASHWEMVVTRHNGKVTLTVRGPETRATPIHCAIQAEWFGIIFKLGSFMPHLLASDLVDGGIDLPEATSRSFWLHGSVWQFPDYENADTFVDRLVREGLLACDPIVGAVLQNQPQTLSARSIERRFLRATGLTQGSVEAGYADRINSIPKHVVSTTLEQLEWNNSRLIKENIAEEVAKLKQEDAQDILVFGSGKLAETLLRQNLVDQYNLLVYPVVLGEGQRLFGDGGNASLKLMETKPYSSSVVLLVYQAA